MTTETNNKTIVKNTLLLYFRMLCTMLISLYTTRVVLDVLGVEQYGIYQAVGGIVVMLSFINAALSNGTSRFLTFELGKGDFEKLKKTFSTLLSLHIIIAAAVVLFAETVGLWFVCNKLIIPNGMMHSAIIVYQLSILTSIITITQVPYNASIISHERMGVYAYLSIFEAVANLLIAYALMVCDDSSKLVLYASLICALKISTALYYRYYCIKNFNETEFRLKIDKGIMKDVLGYSVWNILASISAPLRNQGAIILINIFFTPSVVTARSIANQVNMAANQFLDNFRTAANPQIVKKYAKGDYTGSKSLLLTSTRFSYFMMLLLGIPIILTAEQILKLWLKDVPEYSVIFLQLAILTSIIEVFNASFYTALYAKGRMKENALISPILGILSFPVMYILFKAGFSPVSMAWIMLIISCILSFIIKPILIIKYVNYRLSDILPLFKTCVIVTIIALPPPLFSYYYKETLLPENDILYTLSIVIISTLSIFTGVWFFGLTAQNKDIIIRAINKQIKK